MCVDGRFMKTVLTASVWWVRRGNLAIFGRNSDRLRRRITTLKTTEV